MGVQHLFEMLISGVLGTDPDVGLLEHVVGDARTGGGETG